MCSPSIQSFIKIYILEYNSPSSSLLFFFFDIRCTKLEAGGVATFSCLIRVVAEFLLLRKMSKAKFGKCTVSSHSSHWISHISHSFRTTLFQPQFLNVLPDPRIRSFVWHFPSRLHHVIHAMNASVANESLPSSYLRACYGLCADFARYLCRCWEYDHWSMRRWRKLRGGISNRIWWLGCLRWISLYRFR